MKLGGDGSYDATEYRSEHKDITLLTYSYANSKAWPANSTNSHRILAMKWGKETYKGIAAMGKAVNDECTRLMREGLVVDGVHFTFKIYWCADYKFTRLTYGKGSATALRPCIWCHVTVHELAGSLLATSTAWDLLPEDMPTIAHFRKLAKDREFQLKQRASFLAGKPKASEFESQERFPIFAIDPKDAPLEPLHLVMRIFELLLHKIAAIRFPEAGNRRDRMNTLAQDEVYLDLLRSMGIHFRIYIGLQANEVKILLCDGNRERACRALVPDYPKLSQLIDAMGQFHWIITHLQGDTTTAAEWRHRVTVFRDFMVRMWPNFVGRSVYLHALGDALQWRPPIGGDAAWRR